MTTYTYTTKELRNMEITIERVYNSLAGLLHKDPSNDLAEIVRIVRVLRHYANCNDTANINLDQLLNTVTQGE